LQKAELIAAINAHGNLLDSPVPDIQTPVLQPTAYEPQETEGKSGVMSNIKSFAGWLLNYVLKLVNRQVNKKLEALK